MNSNIFPIDVTSAGFVVSHGTEEETNPTYLPLKKFVPSESAKVCTEMPSFGSLEKSHVVVGFREDPFHPFDGRFERTLRLLEAIVEANPKHVTVQTRSPLIVLALPVLKSLGKNATVLIALEALSDSAQQHLMPDYPRPSERIKAARALKRFNIWTVVQAAPLVWQRNHQQELKCYAETLADICCEIRLLSCFDLVSERFLKSAHAPNLPRRRTCRDAEKILRQELEKLFPQGIPHGMEASLAA